MRWVMVAVLTLAGVAAIVIAPPDDRHGWYVFAVLCLVFAAFPFLSPRVQPLVVVALLLTWVGAVTWPFLRRWHAGTVDVPDAITAIVVVVVVMIGLPLAEPVRRRYLHWRAGR